MQKQVLKLTNTVANKLPTSGEAFVIWDNEIKGFHLNVTKKGTASYYLFYRFNGLQRKIFIGRQGTISANQAREIAKKFAGQIAQGIDVQEEKKRLKEQESERALSDTFYKFVEGPYMDWRFAHRKHPKASYQVLKKHFYPILKNKRLDDINVRLVEQWRNRMLVEKANPKTINRAVAELKVVLSKAEEWDVIPYNKLRKLKRLKVDNTPKDRFLSSEEEKRLRLALASRDERIRQERRNGNLWRTARHKDLLPLISPDEYGDHLTPMILLSINTGVRQGELFSLEWKNINFDLKQMIIEGSKTKNGQSRDIALNKEAMSILKKWRKQSQSFSLIFPNEKGERFDNVNSSFRRIKEEAEIENFRWHDFRHHFASQLVLNNVSLNTVRELLGHRDFSTTLRYAHLSSEHKAAAVEKIVLNT